MVMVERVAIVIPGEPRCLPWNTNYINLFLSSLDIPYDVYICTDTNAGERFEDINNIKSIVEVSRDWQVDEHSSTNHPSGPLKRDDVTGLPENEIEKLINYSKFRMLHVGDVDELHEVPNIGGLERKFLSRHILQWIKTYACWLCIDDTSQYDRIIKLRADISFNYKNFTTEQEVKAWLHEQLFCNDYTGYGDRCFSANVTEFENLINWPFHIEKYVKSCPPHEIHWCDHLPFLYFLYTHGRDYSIGMSMFDLIDDRPESPDYRKRHGQHKISPYEEVNIIL